jgi:succinyl-diaminopimelate desuccinylase
MTSTSADPVALTQALVRCPSVTPEEGGALGFLQSVLEPAGFECHRMTFSAPGTPDVENLYARYSAPSGASGRNLCFAGHTDVVPVGNEAAWTAPPFGAEIRDGFLWGRGAVDMKGAIACFVAAALRHIETPGLAKGAISLLITGDEEGPSINGTAKVLGWLMERQERIDDCILGEPSNPKALGDDIKIGRRGSLNAEIVVEGKQGHSAYPHLADNPVPKLAAFIAALSSQKLDSGTKHFEPSSLEVTVISVPNTATNVIPGEARAKFNMRFNDHWTRAKLEAWVKARCEEAAAACAGARYTLSFSSTGDVFLTEPGPLVDIMRGAVAKVTGRTPQLSTGGGTSDARFIKDTCPVIEFGLVNQTIHSVDERVAVADLERLTEIYQDFIARYFAQ